MALVIFSRPVEFDIAGTRRLLMKHVPAFNWQCGEEDSGAPQQSVAFDRAQLVCGRTASEPVFVELRPHASVLAGPAPCHCWHLEIREPTTEDKRLALHILLVIAGAAMLAEEAAAHCQLRPGGNWLDASEAFRALSLFENDGDPEIVEAMGVPAAAFAGGASGVSPLEKTLAPGPLSGGTSGGFGGDYLARARNVARTAPLRDEGDRENPLSATVQLLTDLNIIDLGPLGDVVDFMGAVLEPMEDSNSDAGKARKPPHPELAASHGKAPGPSVQVRIDRTAERPANSVPPARPTGGFGRKGL